MTSSPKKNRRKAVVEEISVRDYPIVVFALTGSLDEAEMARVAEKLRERLARIRGIKKVAVDGIRRRCVRVELLPERLRAMGISPTLVQSRLKEQNQDVPFGSFDHDRHAFRLKMKGAVCATEALRAMPIATSEDRRVIRLEELARISIGPEAEYTTASLSRRGAPYESVITLGIYKLPGQDTTELIRKAGEFMKSAEQGGEWPEGLAYEVIGDDSQVIEEELGRAVGNGWQSALIVFVVLMCLLSWREALVAALGIPLTLAASVGVLWMLGYTFNIFVLIGIVLALGMLVDDFILMMEGMHQYAVVERIGFASAAWNTVKSYAVPSLSGSVTTILVLVPLAAIGGIDGKFIRIVPITTGICLVLSYLVSVLVAIPLSRLCWITRKGSGCEAALDRSRHVDGGNDVAKATDECRRSTKTSRRRSARCRRRRLSCWGGRLFQSVE